MAWYNPATWTAVDNLQGQNTAWRTPTRTDVNNMNATSGAIADQAIDQRISTVGGIGVPTAQYPTPWDASGAPVDYGTSTPQVAPDPYAKYGGQAAYNSQVNNFNAQKDGILSSTNNAIGSAGTGYNQSILNFLDGLRSGQRGVDQAGVNNEMKFQQGGDDVRNMVGTGLQNAGTMLATRNATSSGSAQKFANAYGQLGRQQMSRVGNAYELGNRDVQGQQQGLEEQKVAGVRNFGFEKDKIVGGIVGEAERSLSALDAAIAGADLPTRIAIEQEKSAIRQRALDTLGQYDATLNTGAQGVQGMDANSRRAEASRLRLAGTAPTGEFDYTTDTELGVDGEGPFASQLPLFTFNRRRTLA